MIAAARGGGQRMAAVEPKAAAGTMAATRWGMVAIVVAAGIAAATPLGKVPPVLPEILAEFDHDKIVGGWIASILHVAAAAIGIVVGSAADAWGHRRMLAFGIVCVGGGSLAGAFADSAAMLLVTRFVEGIGFVTTVVGAPSLIAEACKSDAHRNIALGIWGAYFPIGWGLMALSVPLFPAAAGWRVLWLFGASIMAVVLIVIVVGVRPDPSGAARRRARASPAEIRAAALMPGPWLLGLAFAMFTIQWVGLMTWLPTYFLETAQFSRTGAAIATALVVMLETVGNVAAGWLLAKGFARWRLIAIALGSMGVLSFLILSTGLPGFVKIVCAGVFSAVGGMVPSAVLAAGPVHAPAPHLIGTVNGVLVQGSNIGNLIGPPALAAAVVLLGGWTEAGWATLIAGGVGVLVALAVRAIERETSR